MFSLSILLLFLLPIIGCFVFYKKRDWLLSSHEEAQLQHRLNFNSIVDDTIITGKDGSLTRVYQIGGKNYSSMDINEITHLCHKRRNFFDSLSKDLVTLKVVTLRFPEDYQFEATFDNKYLQEIHDKSLKNIKNNYVNRNYLVVTSFGKEKERCNRDLFEESCIKIENHLKEYKVSVLSNVANSKKYSPLLSFWATLVNGELVRVAPVTTELNRNLCKNPIHFVWKKGYFEQGVGSQCQYGAVLSLAAYGDSIRTLMADLRTLPCKYVLLQQLNGFDPHQARKELSNSGISCETSGGTDNQLEEIYKVQDDLQEGNISIWNYNQSIILFADSLEKLEENVNLIIQTYQNSNIIVTRETKALQYAWRCQFPDCNKMLRPSKLLSPNIAYLMEFVSEPTGLVGNAWGDGALRFYPTVSGNIYNYNVHTSNHPNALGHHIIIAPTGSGKSTMTMHNIAGAMRYENFKCYIIDSLFGCEVFTKSLGGNHINMGDKLPLNPFMVENTKFNILFIKNMFAMIAGLEDSNDSINHLVDDIFSIKRENRILTNLAPFFLRYEDESISNIWSFATGSNKHWFNGMDKNGHAYDALDLTSSSLSTFEMQEILNSKRTGNVLLYYILNRILQQTMKHAVPYWVFIDEAVSMFANPQLRAYIQKLFMEVRKNKGVVSLAFQNPSSMLSLGDNPTESKDILQTILSNCETILIFPFEKSIKKINREDFAQFSLTDEEFNFVCNGVSRASPNSRYVLLKKPKESVILDINLGFLGNHLKIYAADSDSRKQARDCYNSGGNNTNHSK